MKAIDWLFNELWEIPKDKLTWHSILSKAKEMESSQEISDEEIFKQSIKEMEEWYGSDCKEEIDAHFRGAKWMQKWYKQQLK